MDVLVVMEPSTEADEIASGIRASGHSVTLCDDVGRAMVLSRAVNVDLLVASLMVHGEPVLGTVMSAQFHNSDLATIVLSDSVIFSHGELFSMLSSLRCVMSLPVVPADLIEIARHVLDGPKPQPANTVWSRRGKELVGKRERTDSAGRRGPLPELV